jgi:predicted DNA-binding transcriptional regulator YafY
MASNLIEGKGHRQGRWTRSEHVRFLQALKLYGRDWRSVEPQLNRDHLRKSFCKKLRKKEQRCKISLKSWTSKTWRS